MGRVAAGNETQCTVGGPEIGSLGLKVIFIYKKLCSEIIKNTVYSVILLNIFFIIASLISGELIFK